MAPTEAEKILLLKLLQEKDRRQSENRLAYYSPYPKQREFHNQGATKRERLFRAGNQLGKTLAAGAEVAMHLTGRYPDDWQGYRFNRPIRWMAGSESGELTRKGVQRVLLGPPEDRSAWGTGWLPKDTISDWSMKSGVADAVASIVVKHSSGGMSSIQFASYDQGRTKWQADTLDGVWFDEEPPEDIYTEGITRTNVTGGPVMLSATLLFGMTEVVRRFIGVQHPDRADICMTIHDVLHYTDEERQRIIASYPEHEREARTLGIPSVGSGRIFPVAESLIKVDPFEIPAHWPQICGIDFGWDHPTAASKLAWDRDADCIYVTAAYRRSEATPVIHAASVKPWGPYPWAWPHDGLQHDKGSGESLAQQYRAQGLNMLKDKATHPPSPGQLEGTGGNLSLIHI